MIEQWKKHAVHALAASALGAVASFAAAQDSAQAKAIDAASLLRETEAAVRLAGGLTVRTNRASLREDEPLMLRIELPRAGYLNIVNIDAAGVPTVLFPNRVQADNRVAAGTFTLPGPGMGFEIRASAPFGQTTVAAFLTQEKVDLFATGETTRNAAGAVLGTFARLSMIGRDLIDAFATKSLAIVPTAAAPSASAGPATAPAAPMIAGMTTVLTCAKTGPCGEAVAGTGAGPVASAGAGAGARSPLLRIIGALAPGILLEAESATISKDLHGRRISEKGLLLTKASEGFVPQLYEDAASYCTIAYGHLIRRAPCASADRRKYGRRITEPAGGTLLAADMARAERAVAKLVKVPLTEGQHAALCDFTYNVGSGNLQRSTLLKVVNSREHARVPTQLRRWSHAGGVEYRGLKTRREREIVLFFEGVPVPKAIEKDPDDGVLDIRAGEAGR